jgi:hypothetical protein
MMGDIEVDGEVLEEVRRVFERFGPLRAFKFSRPSKRGYYYTCLMPTSLMVRV